MKPPYRIELWSGGNSQLLNVTMSLPAAERVCQESIPNLGPGEVIRVRDSAGALVFSSDPTE
jgi:hypothetical protein